MGGGKLRQSCQQWGVRTLSVSPTRVRLQWVTLHRDMREEQRRRPAESGTEKPRDRAPGTIALNAQIRRQERAGWGRATGEAGSGLLLPQEDLTHPSDHQITALVKAGTQPVTVQPEPEAEGWSPKSQAPSNSFLVVRSFLLHDNRVLAPLKP